MSDVKICDTDGCGTIFSIRAKGISRGISIDPENGQQFGLDYCPDCTIARESNRDSFVFRQTKSRPAIEDSHPTETI